MTQEGYDPNEASLCERIVWRVLQLAVIAWCVWRLVR